jgi:glutamate dehydrogenase (NADP+)
MSNYVKDFMDEIKAKNPAQPEFHQAVYEVVNSLAVVLDRHPEYRQAKIL